MIVVRDRDEIGVSPILKPFLTTHVELHNRLTGPPVCPQPRWTVGIAMGDIQIVFMATSIIFGHDLNLNEVSTTLEALV